jgi:hypothetical protein
MKLWCKGHYRNPPAGLVFEAGVIEVDDAQAEFLLRDAPENFSRELPPDPQADAASARLAAPPQGRGLEVPPIDRAVKAPARKK